MSFVLFADMLGFKRLVCQNRVPYPENLDFRNRANARSVASLGDAGNPLSLGFRGFHGSIEAIRSSFTWLRPASLLVFSDSLFLATQDARDCLGFAQSLMRACILSEVPMRMGVGYGTFVRYGFSFEESPDVTYLSSQFFGSGVVHATDAEKSLSGKANRIAVHRDAVAEIVSAGLADYKLMLMDGAQSAAVEHEWNYLFDWPEDPRLYGATAVDEKMPRNILHSIGKMRLEAGEEFFARYDDNVRAVERMDELIDQFLAKHRCDSRGSE